jgi:hypothetical protein
MAQPGREHRGLDLIHARDGAVDLADVALAPAVHAQQPGPVEHVRVAREHRAGIAERAEVLGRIEAEGGRVAQCADQPAVVAGAVGLCAVLEHLEPVPARGPQDRVHGGGLAVQVDDQDRLCRGTGVTLDLRGVEGVRVGVDVAEHRPGAGRHDGGDRRHASVRRHEDRVAAADAERAQANAQRVGARANADHGPLGGVIGRELALEVVQLGPHQEPAAVQHARHGRVHLGPNGLHAGREHIERHPARRRLKAHTAAAGRGCCAGACAQYSAR